MILLHPLSEKFFDAVKLSTQYFHGILEVYRNPSRQEIEKINSESSPYLRGIIVKDKAAFIGASLDETDVEDILHEDILKALYKVRAIGEYPQGFYRNAQKYVDYIDRLFLPIMQKGQYSREFILAESIDGKIMKMIDEQVLIAYKQLFESKCKGLILNIRG